MTAVAVFGAGRMGSIHALNLHEHHDARVRYVVDVDRRAAAALAARCGADIASTAEALDDEDVTAIVIATSTDTHTNLIESAAAAGKAIFCEKPIDLNVDTARAGVAAVERHGVPFAIGFNRRHDPSFHNLKEQIAAGTIGVVEYVSITSRDRLPPPPGYVETSGGIFRDMMIHDFDMARWLLDEEPAEVFATGSVLIDETIGQAGDVDSAIAVLRTAGGRLCSISNTRRCTFGYDQRIEVLGSLGMLSAGNRQEAPVQSADSSGLHSPTVLPSFLERYADAYRIQLDKFLRALRGEQLDLPGCADGLQALIVADCAQASLESGKSVKIGGMAS